MLNVKPEQVAFTPSYEAKSFELVVGGLLDRCINKQLNIGHDKVAGGFMFWHLTLK